MHSSKHLLTNTMLLVNEGFELIKTKRRVLKDIEYVPTPKELYEKLTEREGWPYKQKKEFYHNRDRALCALLYLGCLRISEALRIRTSQFETRSTHILIKGVELSKTRVRNKPRRIGFREVRLPLSGDRAPFTQLIMNYVKLLGEDARLFPWSLKRNQWDQIIGCTRAWQIVNQLLPEYTEHWLRAFGEDYLYDAWQYDLLAVSDYVKVDYRTLQQYIRKRDLRYPVA